MSQKHIVITGASRGIGFETAKFLASEGTRVTAISRNEKKLDQLHQLYPNLIHPFPGDIRDVYTSNNLADFLSKENLQIDGLIHNAGLLINKPFLKQTDEDWQNQMDVNVFAPARMTKILLPHFADPSHIVCISSMGGFQGSSKFPGLSVYSASKGALSILSECLAEELREFNINCNSLCLGAVQTEMLNEAFPGFDAPVQPAEMAKYIADFTLIGHKYYNGQILPVTLGNPG